MSLLLTITGASGLTVNVHAQSINEGSTISVGTEVLKLSDLLNADLKAYYEEGTLRVTKLQDSVYQIDEETTANPADGSTNNCSSMYLILNDATATLIDAGNGSINSNCNEENMKTILNELVGGKEFQVILTHLHGDHIGLLADNTNVIDANTNVYIHEDDFENLSQNVKNNYKNIITFKGGEILEASGYNLFVVDIPGHTNGSNALIDYDKEVIFSGDAIGSGSVWMFGSNDLISFNKGINNLMAAIRNMNNPVFYCGHRWQQSNPGAHATENTAVGEIGKKYVEEMDALVDDVLTGDYNVNNSFTPSPRNVGIYSKEEKYKDGKFPGIVLSQTAINNFKAANENHDVSVYQPGVTVVKDEKSASGYTAHFVFDPDLKTAESTIASVSLAGDFLFVDSQAATYTKESIHTPHEYQNGMYPTGQASYRDENGIMQTIGGYTEEMEYNAQTGNWELSFPITTGSFTYSYNLTLTDGSTVRTGDPVSDDRSISIVCGVYDEEKQSALPNMDYVRESSGARGDVKYVEYQDYIGNTARLGIYTPANYDKNRTKPYKTIYLSHGSGGDETNWFGAGHADDIMDNYINQGITEEAIIVTMNNQVYNWDFDLTLPNILENVIPFVEANYNVSKFAEDRAMCGLSGGGRTTIAMYYTHPDAFGYFGVLSGGPRSLEPDEEKMNEYAKPHVMAMVGTQDSLAARSIVGPAANSTDKFLDTVHKINPENCITSDDELYVYGAHDWLVWTQGFARFLSDCVWKSSEVNEPGNEQPSDKQPEVTDISNEQSSIITTGDEVNYDQYVLMGLIAMMAITIVLTKEKLLSNKF